MELNRDSIVQSKPSFNRTSSAGEGLVLDKRTAGPPPAPNKPTSRSGVDNPLQEANSPPHYYLVMCITADGKVHYGIVPHL